MVYLMPALLVLALLLMPAAASAGAAFAGMGGVGVGIPDSSGDLADNPAALAGVSREEGVVHLGASWHRSVFAGSAFNQQVTTLSHFPVAQGLGWTMITPTLGNGRIGFGVWQLDRRTLELDEPLDLTLPLSPSGQPLSDTYFQGMTRLRQDELLNAFGAVWIQPMLGGSQQFALGVAYLNLASFGLVEVGADRDVDGGHESLTRLAVRQDLRGFALLFGFFYRPLPAGSVGVSLQYESKLKGPVFEQAEGGKLSQARATRPEKIRVGLGGSFAILPHLTAAVDLKYLSPLSATPSLDAVSIFHAGVEYRIQFPRFELPVRVGFFNKPDALPVQPAGLEATAVTQFGPKSFKQDVTGFSLGSGWERGGLRADLALLWLLVTTHVKREGGAVSQVSSGDVRSTFGAVVSLSLKFGKRRNIGATITRTGSG